MNVRIFLLAVAIALASAASCRAASSLHPVVLVHGYMDDSSKMQWMAEAMRKEGFTVYTPSLTPSFGEVRQEELARQLSVYIDAHFHRGEKIDLVGFSMGGVVCRYYLQRMGGLERVNRFVTLGAPNHGTWWACLSHSPGIRELQPGSDFLGDLNSDASTLNKVKYTTVWTPFDAIIVPSNSSWMPLGRNITIWLPIHPLLVWSPRSIRIVTGILKS